MKKSIVTMLVLPGLLCMFASANVLLPKWQGKPAGDKQLNPVDNQPEVIKYETLLKWSGTTFYETLLKWSGTTFNDEGYELRYEYAKPHTRKKTEKIVSAFGNKSVTGLRPVEAGSNSHPANTKQVSVKTEDGALTLTGLCTLDESGKELECNLWVRNDSQYPVNLRSAAFRIFALAKSISNDSRRSAKTPPKSDPQSDPHSCDICHIKVNTLAGTNCMPSSCNPPRDTVSRPPDINVTRVSLAGRLAITISWRNMASESLQPGNMNVYAIQISGQ